LSVANEIEETKVEVWFGNRATDAVIEGMTKL